MSLIISCDYHTTTDSFEKLVLGFLFLHWELCMIQWRNTSGMSTWGRRDSREGCYYSQMKQRSRWNSFFRASSRRRRLIAVLPAIEIAMYSVILIVAKFDHSSGYLHVNSFVSHYSVMFALLVRSLRHHHILITSYSSALRKFMARSSQIYYTCTRCSNEPIPSQTVMISQNFMVSKVVKSAIWYMQDKITSES